jgi:hypothetical protein
VLVGLLGVSLATRGGEVNVAAGTGADTTISETDTTPEAVEDGIAALGPGEASGEIFLEAAGSPGPDSFTGGEVFAAPVSSTTLPETTTTSSTTVAPATSEPGQVVVQGRTGDRPGLYGGTRDSSRCDAAGMLRFLADHPTEAGAWIDAINSDPNLRWGENGTSIDVADLPSYFDDLTPVTLTEDTRVTNHGFRNGRPTPRQSVLQAGTAVLVDRFGVPRAKCACGNPLIPPKPAPTAPTYVGTPWPTWGSTIVIVVQPAVTVIDGFVLIDLWGGTTFERPAGTGGADDRVASGVATAGAVVSVHVAEPLAPAGGYEIDAPYDVAYFTVDLDPAVLSWIALSGSGAPVDQPAGVGSDRSADGVADILFADVDDLLFVEVTKDGDEASALIHDNDAMGTPTGNQAVIYGYHPSVWFVSHIDWTTDPPTPTATTGPETGELTAFFDEHGAGTYEFTVTYVNLFTDRVSHGELYLISGN